MRNVLRSIAAFAPLALLFVWIVYAMLQSVGHNEAQHLEELIK